MTIFLSFMESDQGSNNEGRSFVPENRINELIGTNGFDYRTIASFLSTESICYKVTTYSSLLLSTVR